MLEQMSARESSRPPTGINYKFDSDLISVLCSCEVNHRQLKKQGLNKNQTVLRGMPCPLGYDESHMLTCFVKPNLEPWDNIKNKANPELTIGLVSNDQFLSIGLALASAPFENFL